MTKTFDRAMLAQFTGTEHYYATVLPHIKYTDGAHYVAETAEAYWLMDAIASWQLEPKVKTEEFQVWNLQVKDERAVLICEDGDRNEVARQEIESTDFPAPGVEMWFANNVIYLPSEH